MPKVGKKEFAYTKAGMKSAKTYAAKTGMKMAKMPAKAKVKAKRGK
jgi:hypothetical protein